MSALFPMEKWRLVGTIVILTIGLSALSAVLIGGGQIVAALSIVGLFILSPLVALLGSDLPFVADPAAEGGRATTEGEPIELLRERYARGDLSKAEFDQRLDRLLATEDVTVGRSASATEREVLLDEE